MRGLLGGESCENFSQRKNMRLLPRTGGRLPSSALGMVLYPAGRKRETKGRNYARLILRDPTSHGRKKGGNEGGAVGGFACQTKGKGGFKVIDNRRRKKKRGDNNRRGKSQHSQNKGMGKFFPMNSRNNLEGEGGKRAPSSLQPEKRDGWGTFISLRKGMPPAKKKKNKKDGFLGGDRGERGEDGGGEEGGRGSGRFPNAPKAHLGKQVIPRLLDASQGGQRNQSQREGLFACRTAVTGGGGEKGGSHRVVLRRAERDFCVTKEGK